MPLEVQQLQSRHKIDLSSAEFKSMKCVARVIRETINKEARTVELSFASEEPVERWFGIEILEISEDACDLSRMNNGAAGLINHDWGDQVAVVVKAWIDAATKKARCILKFSRSVRGEEIFQDILDGIRSLVSVGYIVRKMVLQSVEGDVETHRVTDWMPFEVSVVAVPADTSVGVGRSQPAAAPAAVQEVQPSSTRAQPASTMPLEVQPANPAPAAPANPAPANPARSEQEIVASARTADRNRRKAIRAAADIFIQRRFGGAIEINALVSRADEEDWDELRFNAEVMKLGRTPDPTAATPARQVSSELGLSRREQASYSLFRALRAKAEGRALDGLELEASRAEAQRLGREADGFFVPSEIFSFGRRHLASLDPTRLAILGAMFGRDMSVASPADGGYTVGQTVDTANMVELLRNSSHVLSLGARVISGLVGDVTIPVVISGSTIYWVSETGQITAATPTFSQLVMKPRRIGAVGVLGKQLIAQSSLDVEAFYRETVNADMGVELDRVAINGAGGAEPLGILNLPAARRATSVTFGGAPSWAKIVEFETSVETANALGLAGGQYAYLTTPAARGKWKTTAKAANQAVFLWEGNEVNGYQARSTNQFPSTPVANQSIFGQFGQILYGEWAGIDIVVDNVTLADKAQLKITIQKFVDMLIRQGKAFAISADSAAQ